MRSSDMRDLRGHKARGRSWLWALDGPQWDKALAIGGLSALSVTIIFGTAAAGVFILCTLALVALNPVDSGRAFVKFAPLFILPILAMLSTIWSDAPERTLRASIQLILTIAAAILICRRLNASSMMTVLFAAFLFMCAVALVEVPPSLSSGYPLLGPFASKNAMAYTAQFLLSLAIVVICDSRQKTALRLAAILVIPIAVAEIYLAQSAGAVASALIMLALFPPLALLVRVPRGGRVGIMFVTLGLAAFAIVFSSDVASLAADFRQNVLKKDATLTGRTYLWDFAAGLSEKRPLLGNGYYAFWRQGNLDAEGLWRWGGIASRAGFNFHNAVIEMRVDLGLIGVSILLVTCVVIAVVALYRQILSPTVPQAFLIASLIVLYIRSYAESGLIAPFSLLTVLWIATLVYALEQKGEESLVGKAWSRRKGTLRTSRMPRAVGRS